MKDMMNKIENQELRLKASRKIGKMETSILFIDTKSSPIAAAAVGK